MTVFENMNMYISIVQSLVNYVHSEHKTSDIDDVRNYYEEMLIACIKNINTAIPYEINKDKIKQMEKFINSDSTNCLMYAPTQVGKTNGIASLIEVSLDKYPNLPVVISCDNKNDQLNQMFTRITEYFIYRNDIVYVKVDDKKFAKIMEKNFTKKHMIIFCLDNASQITSLIQSFGAYMAINNPVLNKFVLIHDEGDVITKNYEVDVPSEGQCESHKKWLQFVNGRDFYNTNILKRVFVTATPENIVYKYSVELIRLDIPNNYVGYDKFNYSTIDDMEEIDIHKIVIKHQNEFYKKKQNGAILYSTDRKIENGQDFVFESLISNPEITCTVNTYNSNGIIARVNNPKFKYELADFIELRKDTCKIFVQQLRPNIWSIKGLSISSFYEICKKIGSGVIVTIGMDLVARGISFVSSSYDFNAVAATVLIYKPGDTRHAVGSAQASGRISGTARPDLPRYLYSTEKIIEDYISFNRNQEQYIQAIEDNGGKMTPEEMNEFELKHKLTRNLDRANLRLNPRYKEDMLEDSDSEDSNREDNSIEEDDEKIDNVNKKNLEKWLKPENNDTIAKMVRFIYNNQVVSFYEFKQGINYPGNDTEFLSNINSGRSKNAHYGMLWKNINGIFQLNPNIKNYIDTLL